MVKGYANFMNEITSDELYKGLLAHGLFTEKLPPFLTTECFFKYCKTLKTQFSDSWKQYIYYESIRNINVPRPLGIPNPMAYQRLCLCIVNNWGNLQNHFSRQTMGHFYKVSRIHIRKLGKDDSVFSMSYNNWEIDGTPEPDLLIGSRYLVKADISTCFPSIYTHSIPWALIGKDDAKVQCGKKYKNKWYNQIDQYAQNCKNGETHGLLIGPQASNLLSELILTVVDNKLYDKGWRYIRYIDDYSCYVQSYEDGQKFLVELREELRIFDLSLNFKKTEIQKLPVASVEQWVRKINSVLLVAKNGKMDFIGVRAYLDFAVELMHNNKMNSAILNYAIKVLSGQILTSNARDYCIKTIFHLALIYPYLIPLLEKNLFDKFNVSKEQITSISQKIYKDGLASRNFEAVCYTIYFALKYDFTISQISSDDAISDNSCLFKLLTYLYFQKVGDTTSIRKLKNHAKNLCANEDDFNRNWLFAYEALPKSDLKGEWKPMKEAKVSFVKPIFLELVSLKK